MKYEDSDWSESTLEEMWSDVGEILKKEGEIYNYRLREKLDPGDYGKRGLTQRSLERALVDLRQIKAGEGEIRIEERPGEGNRDRKYWIDARGDSS